MTDLGTGIALPVGKALGHLLVVYHAQAREYPMSIQTAADELNEAQLHLDHLVYPEGFLTDATTGAITQAKEAISAVATTLRESTDTPNDTMIVTFEPAILQRTVMDIINLLSAIDYELTGIAPNVGDAP